MRRGRWSCYRVGINFAVDTFIYAEQFETVGMPLSLLFIAIHSVNIREVRDRPESKRIGLAAVVVQINEEF